MKGFHFQPLRTLTVFSYLKRKKHLKDNFGPTHLHVSTAKKKLRCPNKETAAERTVSVPSKPICQGARMPGSRYGFHTSLMSLGPGVNPKMVGFPQQTMGVFLLKSDHFGVWNGGYHHFRKHPFGYILSMFLMFLNHECCWTSWAPSIDHLVRSRPRHRPATSKNTVLCWWSILIHSLWKQVSEDFGPHGAIRITAKVDSFFQTQLLLQPCFWQQTGIGISTAPWHNRSRPKSLQISKS